MKPVIGVALGDATGIGPEIAAKIFEDDDLLTYCRPIIIGDRRILEMGKEIAKTDFNVSEINDPSQADWDGSLPLLDQKNLDPSDITMGQINAESGRVTGEMLMLAMQLCKKGDMEGFAFGPYHKAAMEYGGFHLLEKLASIFADHFDLHKPFGEMNVIKNLWTSRVTGHIPSKDIAENLSIQKIRDTIDLTHDTLRRAGFDEPRLVVAAFNPHGGEDGLCGTEEIEIIKPAIEASKAEGMNVDGPFPADTLLFEAMKGDFDGVVTMYHDQGQIAMKLMGFETVVTVLAGLPFGVTTPAHGTAFDIAGKGIANAAAMKQSVIIAAKIVGWRE